MAGGMAAAAQGLADLPHRQIQGRQQRVQHAGLSHAGVAGEGAELAAYGITQRVQPLAGDGADTENGDGGAAVNVVQRVGTVQVALVQAQQHLTALQGGDGGDAVDEVRLCHRYGRRGQDHQLVDVGSGGAGKLVAALLHCLHKALAVTQLPDLHPVAHQGAEALAAEFAPGAALERPAAGIHIVEAAEGFFNAPPAQKRISWAGETIVVSVSTLVK